LGEIGRKMMINDFKKMIKIGKSAIMSGKQKNKTVFYNKNSIFQPFSSIFADISNKNTENTLFSYEKSHFLTFYIENPFFKKTASESIEKKTLFYM
jgi:hypothetical protein